MAKLINRTQKGFTIVNNSIMRNKELGMKERGLLITLLSLPDNWNYSIGGLCAILPDGKSAIQSGIKKLEEMGYLRRIQAKAENGYFAGYDWEIFDTPQEIEKPLTENQSTENEETEKLSTGKSPQYNTKTSKTYSSNIYESIPQSFLEYERAREDLKNIMGYSEIAKDEIAKDIFEIAVEVYTSKDEVIQISKNRNAPVSVFKARISALYYEDILRIAEEIRGLTEPIKNHRAYILAALYNASTTSNTYWTNRVNVDLNG